jgi:hypothetical protein
VSDRNPLKPSSEPKDLFPCHTRPGQLSSIADIIPSNHQLIGLPRILLLRVIACVSNNRSPPARGYTHDRRYHSEADRTQLVTAKRAVSFDAAYSEFVGQVVGLLEQARGNSARSVNAITTATYWEIGRRIVEHEQKGKERAE